MKGSAGVPLVPMASVASDRNVIPSGTVLLVEVPDIDNNGNWTGSHKLHLMVALDVGGAVNGHHFDLYRGIGDQAGHHRWFSQNTIGARLGFYNNGLVSINYEQRFWRHWSPLYTRGLGAFASGSCVRHWYWRRRFVGGGSAYTKWYRADHHD